MFGFEKLDAWQSAIDYAGQIYLLTEKLPNEEKFGLTNQMRRAAVSVSSNLAEGSSRSSPKDYLRFVEIAYGSLMETVSQAHIAKQQMFVNNREFERLTESADRLARMLSGLRRHLIEKQHEK